MKKKKTRMLSVLVVVTAILLVANAALLVNMVFNDLSFDMPITGYVLSDDSEEEFLEQYMEVNISMKNNTIFLTNECDQLSMEVSDYQAYSIANGINDQIDFRPTTHDIMFDIFDNFNVSVLMVLVEKMESGTYFATLVVWEGRDILSIDSRPSDAIAIAVRTDAPVYVKRTLMEEYGLDIC